MSRHLILKERRATRGDAAQDDAVGRLVSVQRTRRDGALRQLAQARGIALEVAKSTLRSSCEAQGLDPSSLQAQESVARALLLE